MPSHINQIYEELAGGGYSGWARPMPDDFCPELVDERHSIVCQWHDGQYLNLGFVKTGNAEHDRCMAVSLRNQVWYLMEQIRLGGHHLLEPEGHA